MHLYLLVSGQKDKDVDFVQISPPSNWICTFPAKPNTLLTQRLLSTNVDVFLCWLQLASFSHDSWCENKEPPSSYNCFKWLFYELLTWGIMCLINASAAPRECCCYTRVHKMRACDNQNSINGHDVRPWTLFEYNLITCISSASCWHNSV